MTAAQKIWFINRKERKRGGNHLINTTKLVKLINIMFDLAAIDSGTCLA